MSVLVFEHSPSCRPDRLGAVLARYGHRLRVIRLHSRDTIPSDLDGVDAIVSLGGPNSANDDSPALRAEMAMIAKAHAAALPVLGICLGCQLTAKALGGEVRKLDGPIDLGFVPVSLSPAGREDPIFAGVAWESRQLAWHREEVAALPPGARILASSPRCRVEAWSIGLRTYGIQYHPETYFETLRQWIKESPEDLQEAKVGAADLHQQYKQFGPEFERLAERIFESIALFLMPVDRRYQGLIKDLHH